MSDNLAKMQQPEEELLTEMKNRFVMFPIKYNTIWNMYKKAESAFWTAEEIDLSKDMNDWEKLSDNERHFIKHILAFFAASDGIVNENLSVRFMNEVMAPEAKAFYGFQIAMENIHCVTGCTQILTRTGYHAIDSLVNQTVDVWNGEQFSSAKVVKTSDDSALYKVILSNGMTLNCTPQHKWLIKGRKDRVFTENLEAGMELEDFYYPVIDNMQDPAIFPNAKAHGIACANNTNMDEVAFTKEHPKYFVPINYSKKTKIDWLNGLFNKDSPNNTLDLTDDTNTFTFIEHHIQFMRSLQLLLTTLNVVSHLDVHDDKPCVLTINAPNVATLIEMGVEIADPSHAIFSRSRASNKNNIVRIDNVIKLGFTAPTYCFNEPIRHVGFFNGIATGQSETYSLLIDTYIKNTQEKNFLLNAMHTIPCIGQKADWALKWIQSETADFATRLVAFACVEGIFFSGAFCAIFWLKERGVMPGLCLSNEFISRDEGLHTEFAVLLYSMLTHKLPEETIHEMVKEAVEIEDEFITKAIPCNMLGMNSDLMSQYIKFVADRLVVQLGYDKIYNVANPFDFMDRIGLENKSNFFEHTRLSEYAKANVGKPTEENHYTFALDEEF